MRMQKTLNNLQVLRFIAAVMVLFGHLQHEAAILSAGFRPLEFLPWGAGVDVFFVISGFIMYYINAERFDRGAAGDFLRRRIIRIVPTYWLFTTLALATLLLLPGAVDHNSVGPAHTAASYLFVPWPRPDDASLRPLLALGWTLNFEMLFYGVFALALMAPRRVGLSLMAAAFVLAALLNPFVPDAWWVLKSWSDPIILEFLMGVGLAMLFHRGVRLPVTAAWALVALGFGLLAAVRVFELDMQLSRPLCYGLPAMAICAGLALGHTEKQPGPIGRGLGLGGDASYALYLSHPFAINALALVWGKLNLGLPWVFVAAGIALSVAGSIVAYLLIERPVIRWLGRVWTAKPVSSPAW